MKLAQPGLCGIGRMCLQHHPSISSIQDSQSSVPTRYLLPVAHLCASEMPSPCEKDARRPRELVTMRSGLGDLPAAAFGCLGGLGLGLALCCTALAGGGFAGASTTGSCTALARCGR